MAKKDKSSKAGRNKQGCDKYKLAQRQEVGLARRLRDRLKKHPTDTIAKRCAEKLTHAFPQAFRIIYGSMQGKDEFFKKYEAKHLQREKCRLDRKRTKRNRDAAKKLAKAAKEAEKAVKEFAKAAEDSGMVPV